MNKTETEHAKKQADFDADAKTWGKVPGYKYYLRPEGTVIRLPNIACVNTSTIVNGRAVNIYEQKGFKELIGDEIKTAVAASLKDAEAKHEKQETAKAAVARRRAGLDPVDQVPGKKGV